MITSRFTLTLVALAACRLASAQGDATVLPGSVLSTGGWSPTTTAPEPSPNQPRLLRGNDRVIASPPPSPPLTGSSNAFRFEEAPILDVVHVVLRDILKVDYVIHPPISGTVTLATKGEVSADEAAYLLEGALLANGLVMAPRQPRHLPRRPAGSAAGDRLGSAADWQWAAGTRLRRHRLSAAIHRRGGNGDHPAAHDAARGAGKGRHGTQPAGAGRQPFPGRRLAEHRCDFRHRSAQRHVRRPVPAETCVGEGGGSRAADAFGRPSPAGGRLARRPQRRGRRACGARVATAFGEIPFLGAVKIMPIERLNSILVVSPRAAYLDDARRWIERLDRPSRQPGRTDPACLPCGERIGRTPGGGPERHLRQRRDPDSRLLLRVWRLASIPPPPPPSAWARRPGSGLGSQAGGGGLGGMLQSGQPAGAQSPAQGAGATFKVGGLRVVADEVNNSILVYGTRRSTPRSRPACAASTCRPPR